MNLFLDESLKIDKKGRKREEDKEPGTWGGQQGNAADL
jgi:hypothetical protein